MDSILKLKQAVTSSGCNLKIVGTGDARYKRGFISKNNCVFGRAVILNQKVTHIKWYCRIEDLFIYLSSNEEHIFIQSSVNSFLSDQVSISIYEVSELIKKSILMQEADKKKKMLIRSKMKAKKRPSIKGRSSHLFFNEMLELLIKEKKEQKQCKY